MFAEDIWCRSDSELMWLFEDWVLLRCCELQMAVLKLLIAEMDGCVLSLIQSEI